jgi:carboxymethylenebutenolidase
VEAAGGAFTVHYYEADHAFFNDARPNRYSKENAALAWDRTLTFLKEHVR